MPIQPIITILTDFGTKDGYVGSVKGVLKTICPEAEIIDITQDIHPYDIEQGAFTLFNYYRQFPADTIHLSVVDPGVGSNRKAMILKTDNHTFIGPDNGLFHFILQAETQWQAYEINSSALPEKPKGSTFHARDIFAPTAALLALHRSHEVQGKRIEQPVKINMIKCQENALIWNVKIVSIDRFGNLITALRMTDLPEQSVSKIKKLRFKNFESEQINQYYFEKNKNEPLFIWNSHGFLELAVSRGNAAEYFQVNTKGQTIELVMNQ
ncbi:MAG: hypothetical protein GF313_15205 [Caldithrix sp.]|nr:hypothetical protein [Caldithrix sp.]